MAHKSLIGVCMFAVLLTGCASVSFTSVEFDYNPPTGMSTQPSSTVIVDDGKAREREPGVYTYGRFTVRVAADGSQQIEGGVFTPVARPPQPVEHQHTIFVDYSTKELTYYRKTARGVEAVVGYAVVTPSAEVLPAEKVVGLVTSIETDPWWCPTASIRKAYPDLPPDCLPPGHSQNAMGAAKFIIDWKLPLAQKAEWITNRLHGASGYPSGSFWSEETFGCIRLIDEGILNLIEKLGKDAVFEKIQIVLLKKVQ